MASTSPYCPSCGKARTCTSTSPSPGGPARHDAADDEAALFAAMSDPTTQLVELALQRLQAKPGVLEHLVRNVTRVGIRVDRERGLLLVFDAASGKVGFEPCTPDATAAELWVVVMDPAAFWSGPRAPLTVDVRTGTTGGVADRSPAAALLKAAFERPG